MTCTDVRVPGNLIDAESINPALTAFDSMRWLRKGINIFIPNSSISFSDSWSLSGNLESLLHVPKQQCLVLTILSEIRRLKHFFENEKFPYLKSPLFLPEYADVCLSLAGGPKVCNLFLDLARFAIREFVPPSIHSFCILFMLLLAPSARSAANIVKGCIVVNKPNESTKTF